MTQETAREFEEYMQRCGYQRDPIIWNAVHHAWQAAQAALMPALVEARDEFQLFVDNYAHPDMSHVDYRVGVCKRSEQALARINSVIGDKK